VLETLGLVQSLVANNKIRVSEHAYEELIADDLLLDTILFGVRTAILVEDYPNAFKGPSVLVLQDHEGQSLHVVWGLPKQGEAFATLVTAYLPDPKKWYDGFTSRRPQ
jgi:Domain of unknown function (DUF4258)